jgi:hypothetical protein
MKRARLYDWEVTMTRKKTLNAVQNARKRIAYVKAETAEEAMKIAGRSNPEFFQSSARLVT